MVDVAPSKTTDFAERARAGAPVRGATEFLEYLESAYPEEVLRIDQPVDPKSCEHAAFEEYLAQRNRQPWLIFDHAKTVAGDRWDGLFSNYCGNNIRRMGIAYGLDLGATRPHDLMTYHSSLMRQPVAPQYVNAADAPVKQRVNLGEDARLDNLPLFRNCERDSGTGWFTPIWMVRERESGRYNVSWHRGQYLDPKHTNLRFYPGRDLYEIFHDYKRAGRRVPAVAVIGHHPAFENGAASAIERCFDELESVSGIVQAATQSPLRVTGSETWGDDLLVPADAEIVVEGYILDEYQPAGPWGDAWLNYNPIKDMNLFEVTAITTRRRPLFCSVWPATEADYNLQTAAGIYGWLTQQFPNIVTVHSPFAQTFIVSIKRKSVGEPTAIAASLMRFGIETKNVIVVDEDVDPTDLSQVFFALATRMDAMRDVQIMPMMRHANDLSCDGPTVGGLLIDATKPEDNWHFEIAKPPKHLVDAAGGVISGEMLARIPAGSRNTW